MSVSLSSLNHADRADFTAALAHLFEHSPWVGEETWSQRIFRDREQLHAALCATLKASPREKQLALIRAHPDLAGRLAQQKKLTAASNQEQASAGLDRLSDAELAGFTQLNDGYKARFGFPFVICARLNAKDTILSAMKTRITHSPAEEFATALQEIEKIAWLRLQDTVTP